MNKTDIVNVIKEKVGCKKESATKALDAVIEVITQALQEGDTVKLIGFGTFGTRTRAEKKGRNPQTREEMIIPARTIAYFKPGQGLKDSVK